MRLTKQSEYGLMGLVILVEAGAGAVLSTAEISERVGVSRGLLAAAFKRLARAGVVLVRRGPGGGFRLAKPASRTTLAEVLGAVEGRPALSGCPFWSGHFCDGRRCPLHDCMVGPVAQTRRILASTSLADYACRSREFRGKRTEETPGMDAG